MSELQAAERTAAVAGRLRDPAVWVRAQLREPYLQLLASQVLTGAVALAANILMVRALSPSGRGEVFRQWVVVPPEHADEWEPLAAEAVGQDHGIAPT